MTPPFSVTPPSEIETDHPYVPSVYVLVEPVQYLYGGHTLPRSSTVEVHNGVVIHNQLVQHRQHIATEKKRIVSCVETFNS